MGHMSDRYVGRGPDPSQFMWYMRWWPYAIAHHLNPFIPRVIWAPDGVNIAWTASMPFLSIVGWPLTKWLGLIPSYNLLCLLCPAVAGWSAFLACRMVSRSYWPSVLGGFVFAFSVHMDGKTLGNLNDAAVFAIPLALCAALLWVERRMGTGAFVTALAALLVIQFLCFIELFATMTLAGGVAWAAGMLSTEGERRNRLREMVGPVLASYAIAATLLSPYLYFLLFHGIRQTEIMPTEIFSIDLLNFLIPTPLNALGTLAPMGQISHRFVSGVMESGGYLGPPLIALALVFKSRHWNESAGRVMTACLAILLILAMGPHLRVAGRATPIPLPWKILAATPFIQKALPARLMLYVFLDLAIMTSVVVNELEMAAAAKVSVVAAIVLFALPNLSASYWTVAVDTPEFFSAGIYKKYIAPGENVILMPYSINGDTMLWQAESNMYFNMVQGWTGMPTIPQAFEKWPIVRSLTSVTDLPDASLQLKAFLAAYNVRAVIVTEKCLCGWDFRRPASEPSGWQRTVISDDDAELWRKWFSSLNITPVEADGVLLYRIQPGQFDSYKQYSVDQLERAASRERFNVLLAAAEAYVRGGHALSKLSPARAAELKLIPADWISTRNLPPDPETAPLRDRILLTQGDNGDAAVGVITSPSALIPIVDKYAPLASQVIYISPDPPFRQFAKPVGAGTLLLVMTFARPKLEAAALVERAADGVAREPAPPQGGAETRIPPPG